MYLQASQVLFPTFRRARGYSRERSRDQRENMFYVLVLAPGRAPSTQDLLYSLSARLPLVLQTAFFVLLPLGFLFLLDSEVSPSYISPSLASCLPTFRL